MPKWEKLWNWNSKLKIVCSDFHFVRSFGFFFLAIFLLLPEIALESCQYRLRSTIIMIFHGCSYVFFSLFMGKYNYNYRYIVLTLCLCRWLTASLMIILVQMCSMGRPSAINTDFITIFKKRARHCLLISWFLGGRTNDASQRCSLELS